MSIEDNKAIVERFFEEVFNQKRPEVIFPDLETTVKHQVAEDDYVSAHLAMAGTNTGSYLRVSEPTGLRTEWESMVLFRMEEGKIAELWGTSDRMGMLTKLGLLPDIG